MVSKIFGVNRPTPAAAPVGATATIALAQLSVAVGGTIQGQLTVTVGGPEAFICDGITVTLTGLEQLNWEEDINDSWVKREAKHQFLKQEIPLPIAPQTLMPLGQHVFPFAFPLATNLPPSYIHKEPRDYAWDVVETRMTYAVEASARVKSHQNPIELGRHPVVICAIPMLSISPSKSVHETISTRVKYFCCFEKGTCEVSANTDFDTFDLATGIVNVDATVLNGTTMPIKGLVFSLCYLLDFHVPEGYGNSGKRKISRDLQVQTHRELIAPGTKKEHIPMQFSMATITAGLSAGTPLVPDHTALLLSPVLRPTEDLLFSSVSFQVAIKVQFASSMCSVVTLELPIALRRLAVPYPYGGQVTTTTAPNSGAVAHEKVDELQVQELS